MTRLIQNKIFCRCNGAATNVELIEKYCWQDYCNFWSLVYWVYSCCPGGWVPMKISFMLYLLVIIVNHGRGKVFRTYCCAYCCMVSFDFSSFHRAFLLRLILQYIITFIVNGGSRVSFSNIVTGNLRFRLVHCKSSK